MHFNYIAALFLLHHLAEGAGPKPTPHHVQIKAEWPACGWLLSEALEYVSEVDPENYFNVLLSMKESDKVKDILEVTSKYPKIDVNLLKAVLEMRLYAARTEATRKLSAAHETRQQCDPYFLQGDDIVCEVAKLKTSSGTANSLDHAYPPRTDSHFTIVGSIGTKGTRSAIKEMIESDRRFAFRPLIQSCPAQAQTFENSFGVSLEVRSTIAGHEDSVKHAASKWNLSPQTSKGKDLMALKTAQLIIGDNSFETLSQLSLDYPAYKDTIAGIDVDGKMVQYFAQLNQRAPPDRPIVYINGLEAQPEFLDAFSLATLSVLLRKLPPDNQALLVKSWFKRSAPLFHLPLDEAATVINDLETDNRYSKWSPDISLINRPSRSIFKMVKLNLVTAVVIIDLSRRESALKIMNGIVDLVDQNIPIRFAFFFNNAESHKMPAYYGLLANLGLSEALKFIQAPESMEEYAAGNPRIRNTQFLRKCAEHKDALLSMQKYQLTRENLDLARQAGHYALVNGHPVTLSGVDSMADNMAIFKAYRDELASIKELARDGSSFADYYSSLFKARKEQVLTRSHYLYAPLVYSRGASADPPHDIPNNTLRTMDAAIPLALFDNVQKCGACRSLFNSRGRIVEIESDVTQAEVALLKRYDEILVQHLADFPDVASARIAQESLFDLLQVHMRALFPAFEPERSFEGFLAPIKFGTKSAPITISAIINPLSLFSQRLISLLEHFGEDTVSCSIYLNVPAQGPEPDFNSFYRMVHGGKFAFPFKATVSIQPDCPASWALTIGSTSTDLDNFDTGTQLTAVYVLKGLTVEGSVMNTQNGGPATGQQVFLLDSKAEVDESIVMGNFGYFQLSAPSPGTFNIIANDQEKAVDIYRLDAILLDRLKVAQVKNEPIKLRAESSDTINVFSIATGANYEQLLRIMMLSAVKGTKHKITFWLIESLVSPELRDSLGVLATKYQFDVRYVHYKWPSWLNKQTKRMRAVWAYKVLFLDVLFPLDVSRIIFVDADQVIRGDLWELCTLDMKGRVYGMTAFCDSRKEAEGYRFWKSGYWRDFLQGRPYHISAMFVVDLAKLRSTLTGDILRGHYQALSRDPDSLSNLDQDLPNHLQFHVPIFTIPPEWLWCESWCADADMRKAKIIDLCNNPARSESKLDSAKRIIPEWQALNDRVLEDLARKDRLVDKEL